MKRRDWEGEVSGCEMEKVDLGLPWRCKCGKLNSGIRTHCYRCGKPKPKEV